MEDVLQQHQLVSFNNAAQLPTPAIPTITSVAATCSAAGSSTISNYSASDTYVHSSWTKVGAGGLISGMTVGTNYTVNIKQWRMYFISIS